MGKEGVNSESHKGIRTDLSISFRISSWDMPSFVLPLITEKQTTLCYTTTRQHQIARYKEYFRSCLIIASINKDIDNNKT